MYKVSMVSLGCPKNQVDAEMMLKSLADAGYEIGTEEAEADAIIINTCGFIEDAKKEAIENILEAAEYKKTGKCRALIVTGCLAYYYTRSVVYYKSSAYFGARVYLYAGFARRSLGYPAR